MKILGIETSCDETALSIINAMGTVKKPRFDVLSYSVLSQIKIHKQYGGVFPQLAKREHQKNLIPILKKTLKEAGEEKAAKKHFKTNVATKIMKILEREPELLLHFLKYVPTIARPKIDAIAVTSGPGLEPALWVGINFAKALGEMWGIPVIPINHMEGHIVSVLLSQKNGGEVPTSHQQVKRVEAGVYPKFPALALLVSGGHTELALVKKWGSYKIVGETRDDAVGEAFDKVARMLELPYPGGPHISGLSEAHRNAIEVSNVYKLPRPMIHSGNLDFSFAGLKTAVLYTLKKMKVVNAEAKQTIAREFEEAIIEVLVSKTRKAIETYKAKSLIVGGGVIANTALRRAFTHLAEEMEISLHIPQAHVTTDNALMIAMAGFMKIKNKPNILKKKISIKAEGKLRLS